MPSPAEHHCERTGPRWSTPRRVIVASLLALSAVAIAAGSFGLGYWVRCPTNDIGADNPLVKPDDGGSPAWRRSNACRVGHYVVMVPADGQQDDRIMVGQDQRPLLLIGGDDISLMDPSGKRVLFSRTRKGERTSLSYLGYDPARKAYVDNFDLDGDGAPDARTTTFEAGRTLREYRVGDRWLEIVQQGRKLGVVVDGQFMTIPEAVAKLPQSKSQ